jgi:SAM-dependent methyltransferase
MGASPPDHDWYRTAFGELYPELYPQRDDAAAAREIASLLALLAPLPAGAHVLDVACGGGRHAVALARAGLPVQALDLSPQLLQLARARPPLAGRLVRADMRALPVRPVFDLVLNLFTSFGYFADDAENERALREFARALRPGGRLVLDHANRAALERALVPEDVRERGGVRIHQRRVLAGDRIRKEIRVVRANGDALRLVEDVRLYGPEEMRALVQAAGLTEVDLYGSLAGAPWSVTAERMVVIARRPASGRGGTGAP